MFALSINSYFHNKVMLVWLRTLGWEVAYFFLPGRYKFLFFFVWSITSSDRSTVRILFSNFLRIHFVLFCNGLPLTRSSHVDWKTHFQVLKTFSLRCWVRRKVNSNIRSHTCTRSNLKLIKYSWKIVQTPSKLTKNIGVF